MLREVVTRVHEEHQILCEQRLDGDLWVVDGQVDDGRVELLGEQSGS